MLEILTSNSFSLQMKLNIFYYHFQGQTEFPASHENTQDF